MKRQKILSLSLLLISMYSCSKDENEPQMVIQKTIFEHAPESHGAQDYQRLANQLVQRCMSTS